ncbi:Cytochrome P450 [Mycena kentingensis (nom. inval.)]|nr:Cytochrome P450 [Mycena kentingensis (nom. inval.)]
MDALLAHLPAVNAAQLSPLLKELFLPVLGVSVFYTLLPALRFWYAEMTSPFRDMDGPRSPSLLMGSFKDIADDITVIAKWRQQFGRVFKYKGILSVTNLYIEDVKAMAHIAHNGHLYQKPEFILEDSKRLVGHGILALEGEEHKRQNQAFGPAQIRLLAEGFVTKSNQLRDVWNHQLKNPDGQVIDVYLGLRQMTLDVIGDAGFNYDFDALQQRNGKSNELADLFTRIIHSPDAQTASGFHLLQSMFPALRVLPLPGVRGLRKIAKRMMDISGEIVLKSKAALVNPHDLSGKRDLLSILLSANVSSDIPERQRLSDAEVIAQIPGFFVAGHETTATSSTWALHALSTNLRVQAKLRDELFTLETDTPTMEELNGLEYLDWVLRETLRLYAPVVFVQRVALQEDVLPLSQPYTDKQGNVHSNLVIPKGQMIHIPLLAVNTSTEIWGEDALEFKPERWAKLHDAAREIPGVYSNLMTFWAGAHNCIGWRFSIAEFKAILYALIRAFEFTAIPGVKIEATGALLVVQRPTVAGQKHGSELPVMVKRHMRSE